MSDDFCGSCGGVHGQDDGCFDELLLEEVGEEEEL